MNYFLIKYRFTAGSEAEWRQEIAGFISALDNDPGLKGRISYRVLKAKDGNDYYHLATAHDELASKELAQRDYFKSYTAKIKVVGGGAVDVVPVELLGQTGN